MNIVLGYNINVLIINYLCIRYFILKHITIGVMNLKLMNIFHSFLLFNFTTITIFSMLFWLRGKSALPVLNDNVKAVNICVKNDTDLKKSVPE